MGTTRWAFSPAVITAFFVVIGICWTGVAAVVPETAHVAMHLFFVLAAAGLLYWLVRNKVRAVQESEAKLVAIMENVPAAISVKDVNGRFILANREFMEQNGLEDRDFLGATEPEFSSVGRGGRTVVDTFPGGVDGTLCRLDEKVLKTGKPWSQDIRIGHADGKVLDQELTCFPLRSSEGAVVGVGSIAVDVTDRKRIERQLLENEARFRASWNNAPILFNLKDTEGRYLFCNQTHLDWHCLRLEDAVGKKATDIFRDDLASLYVETDEEALSSGEVCERVSELEYPDGETRRILGIKFPVRMESGELLGVGGVSFDITDRQRTEKALEESERLFRSFVDNSPLWFALKDLEGRFRMINRRYGRALDISPEQAIGKTDFDLRSKGAAENAREWDRRIVEAGAPITYEVRRPDAEDMPGFFLVSKFPVFDADGRIDGIGFSTVDITEREQAISALRFAQAALEKTQDALFWIDRDGGFIDVNEAALQMTGYSRDELLGMKVSDLDPDVNAEIYKRLWEQIQETKRLVLQTRCRRKDRTLFPIEVSANLIEFEGESYQFATVFDISEKVEADRRTRELQMELAHVSRLSTLGEMGAGFAHELNQPLAAIANFAGGALRRIAADRTDIQELESVFERIAVQAGRAGEITNRIRKFVSKDPVERAPSNINATIDEAVGLLSNEALRHDVEISTRLSRGLPQVMADPVQIQQLVINLAQNGIEAISDAKTKKRRVTIQTAKRENGVLVAVTDTGPGIPEDVQLRLFEPFFSTKPNGMGIGLQICHTIVENHDGRLRINPARGGGTVVSFVLPFAERSMRAD